MVAGVGKGCLGWELIRILVNDVDDVLCDTPRYQGERLDEKCNEKYPMLKYNEDFEGDSEDNDCMECAEDLNLNIK